MPKIKVNDVQLFYEQSGSSGDPLVLVHGSWIDHHNWNEVVSALAQSFQVLTYDRRGHSQSERPSGSGSIHQDVADLAALIEELHLAPAHIVGHSFGGSIVLRLAAERPDLFRSMVIHEPPLLDLLAKSLPDQEVLNTTRQRIQAVIERLEEGDMDEGVRLFVETIAFGPGEWAPVPSDIKQMIVFNAPTFLDEMRDPEAFSIDLKRLESFSHSILLTYGEQSPTFLQRIVEKVAQGLPQAQRVMFAGAGHEPEYGHPEDYVDTLFEFFRRATNPASHRQKQG